MQHQQRLALGIDVGTSAIKVCIYDIDASKCLVLATEPDNTEIPIPNRAAGFAEQDPEVWWHHIQVALRRIGKSIPLST
jgi:xylulokinase